MSRCKSNLTKEAGEDGKRKRRQRHSAKNAPIRNGRCVWRLFVLLDRLVDEICYVFPGDPQRNGQFAMEHIFGALHIALVDLTDF